jgi:hypothetical protein
VALSRRDGSLCYWEISDSWDFCAYETQCLVAQKSHVIVTCQQTTVVINHESVDQYSHYTFLYSQTVITVLTCMGASYDSSHTYMTTESLSTRNVAQKQ